MFERILVANRGEIAVRISRAASLLNCRTVAVHADDDARSAHVLAADEAAALEGVGAGAYLDIEQIVEIARTHGCDAVHPGYGFLSENARFAAALGAAGIAFIGPTPANLRLFGDKAAARQHAQAHGVRVLGGTAAPVTLADARQALDHHGAIMIKAVAGGGGRGMRIVRDAEELERAFERAASEASAAFGSDALYVEELVTRAQHIEVQVLGDGDAVVHLGTRDCSMQRRQQKVLEIAPARLSATLEAAITDAAVALARAASYENAGTFEFLLDLDRDDDAFAFIEANARLQVEHTVTEEITGIDIVASQIEIAAGASLGELGLDEPPAIRGAAIQARVNMERLSDDGTVLPTGGVIEAFEAPTGPGVRVDAFGYRGYRTTPRYDSLLAKVVASSPRGIDAAADRLLRALAEFRIDGVDTNLDFLANLLDQAAVREQTATTTFVDQSLDVLARPREAPRRHAVGTTASNRAGAEVDATDPLAVLEFGQRSGGAEGGAPDVAGDPTQGPVAEGFVMVSAPLQGTVVSLSVAPGDAVASGGELLIMESMKMEHEIRATTAGRVAEINVEPGDVIYEGHGLLLLEERDVDTAESVSTEQVDLDHVREDLAEVLARHEKKLDRVRPTAVARREAKGQRTARANVEDLCDPDTFVEYGSLVIAAQRRRRSLEDLIDNTPTDGMITGVGSVNGELFPDPDNRCAVMAYDYTVLAGTQGTQNHRKTDRLVDIAEDGGMPLVLFAEGGGGRPGDTDGLAGSTQRTFSRFAQLSARVPMVGITSGRCFAGNASLLGCCDVIIATEGSNIGMGGPAMIEGGGLGVFAPEEIGPMPVQVANGVVDLLVEDEVQAVAAAKQYLGYFQGSIGHWNAPDQRAMRSIVPENRLRVYEIRDVINTLADEGSVLELREGFGFGMVTALIRIEGRPVGVVANNPKHLGGAIDSDGADKGARFMQLCDAFDIPLLFLVDTPGIMVGPEVEHTALVRHSSRMFVVGANLNVPFFTVVIRKAYGLGAIAMAGGSYKVPYFSISWPTGEFGGMGLEGSVKLGFRKELAAIEDPDERLAEYERRVARAYENGKALNSASLFSVDDTIDPKDTRFWLANLLKSVRVEPRRGKKRPSVDAW